jgi:hypothetical protein
MTRILLIVLLAGVMGPALPTDAQAGPISRACMSSDRAAASPRLCRCIQRAANAELSRADQRLAARFFRDPHRAQEIRQSDRAFHEAFWDRYRQFGARAEAMCG